MHAPFLLGVAAVRIPAKTVKEDRQRIGHGLPPPDEPGVADLHTREKFLEPPPVETAQVTGRRIDGPAARAPRPVRAQILTIRHADQGPAGRNPRNLAAGLPQLLRRHMLQYLGAEHRIERPVGEIEGRHVALYRHDSRLVDLGFPQIERRDLPIKSG